MRSRHGKAAARNRNGQDRQTGHKSKYVTIEMGRTAMTVETVEFDETPQPKRNVTTERREELKTHTELLNKIALGELNTNDIEKLRLFHTWHTKPGLALRVLISTWSKFAKVEKAVNKGESPEVQKVTRDKLTEALNAASAKLSWLQSGSMEQGRRKKLPVHNLPAKITGNAPASVEDTIRIVTAMIFHWPHEELPKGGPEYAKLRLAENDSALAQTIAERFVRTLLMPLLGGNAKEWESLDREKRAFRFKDEERISVTTFLEIASTEKGALIIAASKRTFIERDPVDSIKNFAKLADKFSDQDGRGLVIFLINASIFEDLDSRHERLYNLGLLNTAILAYALECNTEIGRSPLAQGSNGGDGEKWRGFARRCCIVMWNPPLIDTTTGLTLAEEGIDKCVGEIGRWQEFGRTQALERLRLEHLLPQMLPLGFRDADPISGDAFHCNVRVTEKGNENELQVKFFVVPQQEVAGNGDQDDTKIRSRGRPIATEPIEGKRAAYLVDRRPTDKPHVSDDHQARQYDNAYRAIYLAARGRLAHTTSPTVLASQEEESAIAALRQEGFEVFPVAIAVSLLPELITAAARPAEVDSGPSVNEHNVT